MLDMFNDQYNALNEKVLSGTIISQELSIRVDSIISK